MKTKDECRKVTIMSMCRDRMSKVSVVVIFFYGVSMTGKVLSYKYIYIKTIKKKKKELYTRLA